MNRLQLIASRVATYVTTLAIACAAVCGGSAFAQPSSWNVSIGPLPEWPTIPDEDFQIPHQLTALEAYPIVPETGGCAAALAQRILIRERTLTVEVWDLAARKQIGKFEVPPAVEATMAVSPSGKKFAQLDFLSDPKKIRVFDVASGRELTTHDPFEKAGLEVFDFLDEDRLLMIPNSTRVRPLVWDTRDGREVPLTVGGRVTRSRFAIDPTGHYVVLGDSTTGKITFTDTTDGSIAGRLDCRAVVPGCQLLFLGISTDGSRLGAVVNASSVSRLLLWDTSTGNLVDKFPLEDDYTKLSYKTRLMQWCPGGRAVWLNGNRLVDLDKKKEVFRWENRNRHPPRPVTPTRVLHGHYERNGPFKLMISQVAESAERPPTSPANPTAGPPAAGTNIPGRVEPPTGDRTGCRNVTLTDILPLDGYTVPAPPAAVPVVLTKNPIPLRGFTLGQPAILFSAPVHGKVIVEGCREERSSDDYFRHTRTDFCDRYDLKTGQRDATFEFPTRMHVSDLDSTGRYVAVRADDRAVVVYDFDEQRTIANFQPYGGANDRPKSRSGIDKLDFVDAQHLITSSFDGRATLWKLPECRAVYEITGSVLRGPAVSPDRKIMIIFTGSRRFVMLHVATGDPIGALSAHSLPDDLRVWAFSYSPDGASFGFVATKRENGIATLHAHRWSLADTSDQSRAYFSLPCRDRLLWFGRDRYALVGTGPTEPKAGSDLHLGEPGRITSQRTSLLDLDAGMVVWHFDLPSGCCATSNIDNRLWYVNRDDQGYHLRSIVLPSETKWRAFITRQALAPPVRAGDSVGVGVYVADTVPDERRAELANQIGDLLKTKIIRSGFRLSTNGEEIKGRLTFSVLFASRGRDEATGVARFLDGNGLVLWERKCLFVSKRLPFDSAMQRNPQPIPVRDPLESVCTWIERYLKLPESFVDLSARQKGIGMTRLSGDSVKHATFSSN